MLLFWFRDSTLLEVEYKRSSLEEVDPLFRSYHNIIIDFKDLRLIEIKR